MIITVKSKVLYSEICEELADINVEARTFHLYDNIAFFTSYFTSPVSYTAENNSSRLRVNIVFDDYGWILSKFAYRMESQLNELGIEVSTSNKARNDVDINHHIQFATYAPLPNDTLMISHVDSVKLLRVLKKQLETAAMGICMSRETMNQLVAEGISRRKLCYINPAHDGIVEIKKYVVGITHRCYEKWDVRKRTSALLDMLDGVEPVYFRFIIMGEGWNEIVSSMERRGFEVTYYPKFKYDTYMKIIPQMDYYFFMGFDEGSMGYLDALTAGVGTIVTPQGFHLDNHFPIDYPCRTVEEFRGAFLDLQTKRKRRIQSVKAWSWENYTKKHVELWNYILRRKTIQELFENQLLYEDGIFSTLVEDNRISLQ